MTTTKTISEILANNDISKGIALIDGRGYLLSDVNIVDDGSEYTEETDLCREDVTGIYVTRKIYTNTKNDRERIFF